MLCFWTQVPVSQQLSPLGLHWKAGCKAAQREVQGVCIAWRMTQVCVYT